METLKLNQVNIDFGQICRLCLQNNVDRELISLFQEHEQLPTKIYNLMKIQVVKDDCYPSWICTQCAAQVEQLDTFVTMCKHSLQCLDRSIYNALMENRANNKHTESTAINDEDEETIKQEPEIEFLEEEYLSEAEDKTFFQLKQENKMKEEQEEENICNDCSISFNTAKEMLAHRVGVHHDDLLTDQVINDVCDTCGCLFSSKLEKIAHIRVFHTKKTKKIPIINCKFCKSYFKRSLLRNHLIQFHKINNININYDCQLCFRPFKYERSLRIHIKKNHKNLQYLADLNNLQIVWQCHLCDSLFSGDTALSSHYSEQHSKPPAKLVLVKSKELVCSCGAVSAGSYEAFLHQVYAHNSSLLNCELCDAHFISTQDLKCHLLTEHSIIRSNYTNDCCFCLKSFHTIDNLKNHLLCKHKISVSEKCEIEGEKKESRCVYCARIYMTSDVMSHHEECPAIQQSKCFQCNKIFTSFTNLKRHFKDYHKTLFPMKCPVCEKVFLRKLNLHNHYKMKHLPNNKIYRCSFCDLELKGKTALRIHEDGLHKNIRIHQCPTCPESFTTLGYLKKHMERHDDNRPVHYCHYCNKKYNTISGIERHIKMHEGVKDFICAFQNCGKSFYTKNELRRHMKYHTRDFQFNCNVCERSFVTRGELKKHSTKHTGERPYKCNLCSLVYSRRDNLLQHLKRIHYVRVKKVYGMRSKDQVDEYIPIDKEDSLTELTTNIMYVPDRVPNELFRI